MTEAEWLTSVNAQTMIVALSGKGSDRLWRLFAVACAHSVEHLMRDDRSRIALQVAARFADGEATLDELKAAQVQAAAAAHQAHYDEYMDEIRANFHWDAEYQAAWEASCAANAALQCLVEDIGNSPGGPSNVISEGLQFPDLLREIFGNPFQWIIIDPVWLSQNDGAARKIAQTIYADRAFDRLPILADALEDAGCVNADILTHCHSGGEHVRGCWVVDLILGKE